jgi:hypothetical protein
MNKNGIKWLDAFVQSRKDKMAMKKTASKKVTADALKKTNIIVMSKSKLPSAKNGSTVKYANNVWKVIDANFSDSIGKGVVLKKVADIDTKPLCTPETRAYTDPGNVYDYEVRDTSEVPDFQEAAQEVEQQVAAEDAIDRTTPDGRYTNPLIDSIINDTELFDDVPAEQDAPVETPAEEVSEDAQDEAIEAPAEEVETEESEEKAENETPEEEAAETPEDEAQEEANENETPEEEEKEHAEASLKTAEDDVHDDGAGHDSCDLKCDNKIISAILAHYAKK